ncbi:MAG: asparagine synthase (glutamine-hydrolyzing) [Candidatus Pseudobacter hemicellulosilyticus]|uniref:asparagine synthase (glutamine-hydrolyzing) n=1 Tax=Candidatus Pseudobacter hemicellulosilyticus TaxID=3121375 RepID=A0AAJ6BH10_9BACT|nr:MAG: asparagine synthase (glutamine-hydrolyzing) [Pseudobacter sp.]
MCGIAGIIASDPSLVQHSRLKAMITALAHRGPDGEAAYIHPQGHAGFAHRRLAIIDLSPQAAQPMHYLDRYTIVYNGELYNYKELKATLQTAGLPFHTQSDTEVILAAYHHYREACLEQFDGMFAFAIWDNQEQTLFAARDRFGEKPFYYVQQDGCLLFASEMKALWAAGIPRQMEESMLYNFLTLGYVQNPWQPGATFYKGIHKLPARHYLQYQPGTDTLSLSAYWDLDATVCNNNITPQAAVEQFTDLFRTSVQRRLRSDVPLGTSLSGGLDSSSVLATIMQLSGASSNCQTFSATYPGFPKDESAYIAIVTRQLGVSNHQVQPDADSFMRDFEQLCYHQEEPFQSSSLLAQFNVYALAKEKGITVLLDGQGADEILAGYTHYYSQYWQELYRKDRSGFRRELAAARAAGITADWNWKHQLTALFPAFSAAFLGRSKAIRQKQQPDLNRDFVAAHGASHYARPHLDSLNGLLYYNSFQNGLETLLQYADRNSMAHGRELRLPFLYHELVSFVFSLPATLKIREGYSKWLLRKSMEPVLPATIVWRKDKIGFETPQQSWMQDRRIQELIRGGKEALVQKGVLKPGVLTKKIQPQENHAADNFDWRYLVAGTLQR